MKSISLFFKELKRRNIFKRLVSYAVFSWAIIQVIVVMGSIINIPSWVGKTALSILLIFLPIWLVLSWFYDIQPSGIKRITTIEGEIDETQNIAIGKRLNIFILVFLSLAIILLIVDRTRLISEKKDIAFDKAKAKTNSIAILPFKDISASKDQAYFADGLAEELISMLSKISNIKVTSRTSAFSFKDKTLDIPSIAKQLGVNYILEGSVRTHNNIVRVSVQLIDANNDSYSWSQSWDKQLENIFQVQNEISELVTQKLEIELTDNLINRDEKVDPEAYRLYLRAKHEIHTISDEGNYEKAYQNANDLLKKSIQLDSTFASSWELLSHTYHQLNNTTLMPIEKGYVLAKNAAHKALEIDSTYASAYDILATIAIDYEKDYVKAQQLVRKGLAIEPQNPQVMERASEVALIFGDPEKALEYNLQLVRLDPLDEASFFDLGTTYYFYEKYTEAEENFKKSLKLDPNTVQSHYFLSLSLLFQNKLETALEAAKKEPLEPLRLQALAMIHHALGNKKEAAKYVKDFIVKYEENWSYQIACIYAFQKDSDNAFLWLDKAIYYKDFGIIEAVIDPIYIALRKDARWPLFLEKSKSLSLKQTTLD